MKKILIMSYKKILNESLIISLFCIILTAILIISFKAWRINWNIPYSGLSADGTPPAVYIGDYFNGNNFWTISNLNDHIDTVNILSAREGTLILAIYFLLAHIFSSIGQVLNFYSYLTYLLVGVFSYFTFRKIVHNKIGAFCGGLMYTLLPYHYEKVGYGHIALVSYFLVPIICMGAFFLIDEKHRDRKSEFILVATSCCLMTGFSLYYACYSLILFAFVFLYDLINQKQKLKICMLYIVSVIIGIAVCIFISSKASDININGTITSSKRDMGHILSQSINLFSLAVPIIDHPVGILHNYGWRMHTENSATWSVMPMGFLVFLGLMFSIFSVLFLKKDKDSILFKCGLLNIYLIIFGILGGLATLIALINASIRNYTRLSIFIAYYSVLVLVYYIDHLQKIFIKNKQKKIIFIIGVVIAFFMGIIDITSPSIAKYSRYDSLSENFFTNPYKDVEEIYLSYQDFFQEINKKAPKKIMLFPCLELFKYTKTTKNGEKVDSFVTLLSSVCAPKIEWDNGFALNTDLGYRWIMLQTNLSVEQFIDYIVYLGNEGIVVDSSILDSYEGINKADVLERLYDIADYTASDQMEDLIYFDLSSYRNDLMSTEQGREMSEWLDHIMYEASYNEFEDSIKIIN